MKKASARLSTTREVEEMERTHGDLKPNPDLILCYYDGMSYSPGAFIEVDGLKDLMLYCKADGTWDVKDPPAKNRKEKSK